MEKELARLSENVSVEKRTEVQNVLNHVFDGVSKMQEQLDSVVVADENDTVNMKLANTIRLGVKKVRLDAEKTFDLKRSEVQAKMLSFKTEDQLWLKAKQTMQILTKEIEENAKRKEETKKRFDAEQKELKIQQRILSVSKFNPEIDRLEFENMSDAVFDVFLSGIEKDYNDRIEAEKKEEEERIAKLEAERIENERIRVENERLRKESEKKERLAKIEAEKQAKIQAELKAKAEAERKEREKIEKELKEKSEAELKAKQEKEEKKRKEKNAPDKEKLIKLSEQLTSFELPEVLSDEAAKIIANVKKLLSKVSSWIDEKSEKL